MLGTSGTHVWNRRITPRGLGRQFGFTYLGLMALIIIIGISLMAVNEVWHTAQRRAKEQELLFVGNQFRRAIELYYQRTPANRQRYPMDLEELLKDPRYPTTQRYLRKIYRDPINGGTEWGVVRKPDGGIYGVHSLSEAEPLKKGNFRMVDKDLEGRSTYADWVFAYLPQENTKQSKQPAPPQRP